MFCCSGSDAGESKRDSESERVGESRCRPVRVRCACAEATKKHVIGISCCSVCVLGLRESGEHWEQKSEHEWAVGSAPCAAPHFRLMDWKPSSEASMRSKQQRVKGMCFGLRVLYLEVHV